MDHALLVYTTFPDEEVALSVGETLVRDGLVACVNVIPGMRSVYSWQGALERGTEVVAIIKTRTALRDEVGTALKARHPYETPIILYLQPEGGDPGTLTWLFEATRASAARD